MRPVASVLGEGTDVAVGTYDFDASYRPNVPYCSLHFDLLDAQHVEEFISSIAVRYVLRQLLQRHERVGQVVDPGVLPLLVQDHARWQPECRRAAIIIRCGSARDHDGGGRNAPVRWDSRCSSFSYGRRKPGERGQDVVFPELLIDELMCRERLRLPHTSVSIPLHLSVAERAGAPERPSCRGTPCARLTL